MVLVEKKNRCPPTPLPAVASMYAREKMDLQSVRRREIIKMHDIYPHFVNFTKVNMNIYLQSH